MGVLEGGAVQVSFLCGVLRLYSLIIHILVYVNVNLFFIIIGNTNLSFLNDTSFF